MVTLEKLKSYLRIDVDVEDSLLSQFLEAAQAYLSGAVSNYYTLYHYKEFAAKADLLTLVMAAEFYQNRDNSAHDMSYTIRSLIAQLQNFTVADSDSVSGKDSGKTIAMFDGAGNLIDSGIRFATDEEISAMLEDSGLKNHG